MTGWKQMDQKSWTGLCCHDCRGSLGTPWYLWTSGRIRICQSCYTKAERKAQERIESRQKRLFVQVDEQARKIPVTLLKPPYADRHPVPDDIVLNPSEEAPF